MLQSGALTQLEWVDRCAAEWKFDGVDFGASHFPRTDGDYLAQLKKLCVDRGLSVASVAVDIPFGEGDVDRQVTELDAWTARALALGAPVVRISCGTVAGSPGVAWRELVRGLKTACMAAKERNVTFALEARALSLVATPADAKRVLKECDSAWLRLAPTLLQLSADQAAEWFDLIDAFVFAVGSGSEEERSGLEALRDRAYIGFVSLECEAGDDATTSQAIASFRPALASLSPTSPT